MNDNTLIRVFGGFAAICVAASLGILFNYDGDKVQAFGLLAGIILLFIPSLLGFKKSADAADKAQAAVTTAQTVVTKVNTIGVKVDENAIVSQQNNKTLAVIAPKVEQVVAQVAPLAEKIDQTSDSVNGAVHSWIEATERISAMQRTIDAQDKKLAVIEALQRGAEQGRQQLLDDTTAMDVARANDPDAPTGPP